MTLDQFNRICILKDKQNIIANMLVAFTDELKERILKSIKELKTITEVFRWHKLDLEMT